MKHFNVEAYAKTLLSGMVITPEDNSWQEISENFDKQWHRKRTKTQCIRIALAILFAFALPVSIEKSNEGLLVVGNESITEEKDNLSTHSQIPNDTDIGFEPSSGIVGIVKKSDERANEVKVEVSQVQLAPTEKLQISVRQNGGVQGNWQNSKDFKAFSHAVVTDAELDSLITRARQNIEMERALQRERAAFANEMLADIEKEMKTKNRGFYHDIKRGYTKLKTVISN